MFLGQEGVSEEEFSVEGMGSAHHQQKSVSENKNVRFTETKEIPKICLENPTSKVLPTDDKINMKIDSVEPKSKFQQINTITDNKERAR